MGVLTKPQEIIYNDPSRFRVVSNKLILQEIINRKDALERGLVKYFTGKSCKKNHISLRYVSTGECVECLKLRHSLEATKKSKANSDARYRKANKEKISDINRIYRQRNKDRISKVKRQYELDNIDKIRPEKAVRAAKRRARKKMAIPSWYSELDDLIFLEMQHHCKDLEILFGVKYNIDHKIPLQSNFVCGLHCKENWEILDYISNVSKGNRFGEGVACKPFHDMLLQEGGFANAH